MPAEISDAQLDSFVDRSARRLGEIVLQGAGKEPGYLVLNPLAFDRTVSVELPKLETAPALQAPIRSVQLDRQHRSVVLDLPSCGYVWIPARSPKSERPKGSATAMTETEMIRNEFIEVYMNEATGGIGRIKQYGRKPNRLSQQLALRFARERTPRPAEAGQAPTQERTFYSEMRCSSISVTSSGPGLAEIVSSGKLIDPEDGSLLAEFGQTVRLWAGPANYRAGNRASPHATP